MLRIRTAIDSDREAILKMFHEIVAAGDTYAISPLFESASVLVRFDLAASCGVRGNAGLDCWRGNHREWKDHKIGFEEWSQWELSDIDGRAERPK